MIMCALFWGRRNAVPMSRNLELHKQTTDYFHLLAHRKSTSTSPKHLEGLQKSRIPRKCNESGPSSKSSWEINVHMSQEHPRVTLLSLQYLVQSWAGARTGRSNLLLLAAEKKKIGLSCARFQHHTMARPIGLYRDSIPTNAQVYPTKLCTPHIFYAKTVPGPGENPGYNPFSKLGSLLRTVVSAKAAVGAK